MNWNYWRPNVTFLQIQINFLPVGHTHEDIDQLFSSVAREIRQAGCDSIPGRVGQYTT